MQTSPAVRSSKTSHIYVVDGGRISKYDPTSKVWAQWGNLGGVSVIAVDKQGNVYVSRLSNSAVQKLDGSGKPLTQWGNLGASVGAGENQFNDPEAIAVDGQGNVFVMDAGLKRIQKFDNTGKFLTMWGSQGNGDGQFNQPRAMTTDAQGNVYVVDGQGATSRVEKFDNGGKFLSKWNECGGFTMMGRGIAVDQTNRIHVASESIICSFDAEGKFLSVWKGDTSNPTNQFKNAIGIAADSSGNTYVTDGDRKTIQEFEFH